MEHIERPAHAPAVPFLGALVNQCVKMIRSLTSDEHKHPMYADVAFSDNLERELIQRELHPR
jgi:hypothetical protein